MTAAPNVRQSVAVADPGSPDHVIKPNADGSVNVNATVTATAESTAEATAAAPSYAEGQDAPLSQTLAGSLRVTNTTAIAAGENHIGAVGGATVHLTAAPAVTAGAYTTGLVVGGLISLSGAARVNSGSGIIQSVLVTVKTALTAPYDIFFFDTNPTNSTFTDNAALAINVADLPFLCGVAQAVTVIAGGTPTILQATQLALPFKLSAAATTLYAVIVIRGSQSFASTSAISLSALILQD